MCFLVDDFFKTIDKKHQLVVVGSVWFGFLLSQGHAIRTETTLSEKNMECYYRSACDTNITL